MLKINKVYIESINSLRNKYYEKITVPMDDMWENKIIPSGDFYTISDEELLGYFVIGDNNTLLQFYLTDDYECFSSEIFEQILEKQNISGAFAGTFEPGYLSLCLDKNIKVEVDTLLYMELKKHTIETPIKPIKVKIADIEDYSEILDFNKNKVGLKGDWMEDYYKKLLPMQGVHLFKLNEKIIGIGEFRPSKSNTSYANLGIMVSNDFRRKNLGSYILSQMRILANVKGFIGICSTTIDNIGSQKAIEKSGFYSYHRILKIKF